MWRQDIAKWYDNVSFNSQGHIEAQTLESNSRRDDRL